MTNPNDKPILNEGIDTSFWKRDINFSAARDAGKTWIYPKASEGTFIDPSFVDQMKAAKQTGFLRGGFHYFRAAQNPILQAQTFLGAFIDGDFNQGLAELNPMLDIEWNPGKVYEEDSEVPPSEWARRSKIILEYIKKETGITPGIYTSLYMWRKFVDPFGECLWAQEYPLWVAQWEVPSPSPLPKPFLGYLYHQYGTCIIDGLEIDANRFHGENIFDYAQLLYINRTKQINDEIETARESYITYQALKDAQYQRHEDGIK